MPLAQKHAHFDTLGLVHKIVNLGAKYVKEILYSNDGEYVFLCNLYTDGMKYLERICYSGKIFIQTVLTIQGVFSI